MLKRNAVRKYGPKLAVVGGSLAALPSFATGTDFSTLTAAADFSTAATAILTVMAALALALIAWKGGKLVLRAF